MYDYDDSFLGCAIEVIAVLFFSSAVGLTAAWLVIKVLQQLFGFQ